MPYLISHSQEASVRLDADAFAILKSPSSSTTIASFSSSLFNALSRFLLCPSYTVENVPLPITVPNSYLSPNSLSERKKSQASLLDIEGALTKKIKIVKTKKLKNARTHKTSTTEQ